MYQSSSHQSVLHSEIEQLRSDNRILKEGVASLHRAFASMQRLTDMMENVSPESDVFDLLDTILEAVLSGIEASDGSVMLVDDETNELVFAIVSGQVRDKLTGHRLPIGTGIAGWVAQKGDPVIVPNVHLDPRFSRSVDRDFRFKTQSLICTPMIYNGKTLGVIQGLNKIQGKQFLPGDLTLLQVVAYLAAEAITRYEAILNEEE